MLWIDEPVTLRGRAIDLLPLDRTHFPVLENIASDKRIWEFMSFPCDNAGAFQKQYDLALEERDKGIQYPFVIYHKKDQRIIGATRYLEMVPAHRKLEIGWTWLNPQYWASDVNPECKLLLLTHCFEKLHTSRVTLRTSEFNIRSRKAIGKIGASFEGIIRNDIITANQTKRNSAWFSIIEEEWPAVKQQLTAFHRSRSQ